MGYRPDPVIAQLMTKLRDSRAVRSSGRIAFVNPHADPQFAERGAVRDFFTSAINYASDLGYDCEKFWLNDPNFSRKRLPSILLARGFRGVVFGSTAKHDTRLDFSIDEFAAITVGLSIFYPPMHRVVTHHYQNARLALSKVEEAGFRRIGFISGARIEAAMDDHHLAAFLVYQRTKPAGDRIPPLVADDLTVSRVASWINRYKPEVVLGPGELPHCQLLTSAGFRIPRDISYVHLTLSDNHDHSVAGVSHGYDRLGEAAIDLLDGAMRRTEFGPPNDPKIVQVDGRWNDGPTMRTSRKS